MIRIILLAVLIAPVSAGEIKFSDASGRVWIAGNSTESRGVKIEPVIPAPIKVKVATPPTAKDINRYIKAASVKYQVDDKLIRAVIKTESTYRTKAVSKKGAVGLMQLMPATASRFGVLDRADVQQNIDGGVKFLRFLLDTYKDTRLAVAGYNAGEHAVMRHKNTVPPYPETQNYVGLVMAAYKQ
jgi:soluble lytic murein transglycosylase-like protein